MKKFLLLFVLTASLTARSQTVAGYWYGTASVGNGSSSNNYLIEIILKQNQTAVQAIMNYYFRNTFRSIQVNGSYNSMTRELSIFNIPLPYHGSTDQLQVDCQMDLLATHRVSKVASNLVGRFVGKKEYRYTCPDIVFDLKLNQDAGNQDSILVALRNFKETYQLWTPSARDTLLSATVQQRPIQNIVVNREYKDRQVEFQNELEVDADSVQIDLYDNGEVDGDSISVFFNDQLLGANLKLSTRSIHLNIALDSTREFNTLAMFANNLGSIPPNTALMIIYDGRKRHEIRLSSSLDKSAALKIRRKKK
ncbi:MAG TPA: hypothetical protein VFR58_18895 [Flavisolibacter sp.]|nr:hypothetical protein [Flavisolibacter sp.]